jgi:sugar phosphate isomerase/epimerase
MNARKLSRRKALTHAGLVIGAAVMGDPLPGARAWAQPQSPPGARPFRFCLNMATIRGQKLGIVKETEIAAQAGYDAIEPWMDTLEAYVEHGGALKDLAKRISDAGLTVEGAIGFAEWLVEDEARRARGLERAKRDMELAAQIGARRIAAPPAGATGLPKLDFVKAAERYRALLELGDQAGLVAEFELWGASRNFGRLGECVGLAMETGHPRACVLADVFHLYKGGSDCRGIRLLGPDAIQVLHVNDYPSDPPRERIDDSYRVFPGDGTAPLVDILRALRKTGGQPILSLELFNRKYWAQDPLEVARTGLAKMKALAEQAGSQP